MIQFDFGTLILIIIIHALLPITWMNFGPVIPFVIQTSLVIAPVFLLITVYRKSGKKWSLIALPPVHCIITLLSNILVANVWHSYM